MRFAQAGAHQQGTVYVSTRRSSEPLAAQQKLRELERLIGKRAVDLEILRAMRDEVRTKTTLLRGVRAVTGRPLAPISRVLGIALALRLTVQRVRRWRGLVRVVTGAVGSHDGPLNLPRMPT